MKKRLAMEYLKEEKRILQFWRTAVIVIAAIWGVSMAAALTYFIVK